ncbi:hypothetical protein DRW41_19295 [Neobacillus piezotolerans]|uniref:Uncharacterized protein n=1 Tax=Neobacillus piezotolerans TaxID=2259171 RepID=A0A3D8GLB3_9BACI|nr:hypothetical protein [Neobacillus piezotolerans]RDU35260.1 hypothetical protein DRW41_19295 [Neobacillus piezotolerans]
MELVYTYDQKRLDIREKRDGEDFEFTIIFTDQALEKQFNAVRDYFYGNDDLTDAYFYKSIDKQATVSLKQEYYTEFLLQLFKNKLILSLLWK